MMRRPNGYWQDPENIIAEAEKAMQEQGWKIIPGSITLRKHGYTPLATATKYHGGFTGLRKLLGQQRLRREDGLWKTQEYILQQARELLQKEGWTTIPGATTIREHGYSSLVQAADKFHGGLPGLRKLLGQEERLQTKAGLWQNQEYLIQQAEEAMQKQGWKTLPSAANLRKQGYSRIAQAAHKYHNGITELRKLLGQEQRLRREDRFWHNQDNLIAQAQQAMEEQGWPTLPGQRILTKNGYGSLVTSARLHGGIPELRKLLEQHSQQPSEQEQLETLVGGYDG